MESKIGLITFHESLNCGSMLQAFALQNVLDILGIKNEFINFANQGSRDMYSLTPSVWYKGRIRPTLVLNRLLFWFYRRLLKKQKNDYLKFQKRYLRMSVKSYSSNEQLCTERFEYTHYITGSDQVWNICCSDADDAYYLNFVRSGKKIAYAVSLGATILKEKALDINKYKTYLKSFDAISVREKNAINQIEELCERDDVKLLVDPTLLLYKNDWEKIFDLNIPLVKGKYIFYYAFSYSKEVNRVVKDISKRLKMPVYILDATSWGPKNVRINGFKLTPQFGPIAFLNMMKHATLCLTTSFHGTVFSVIFEKPFWFINSSMHDSTDDRAESLLSQLGLIHHYRYGSELMGLDLFEHIDYAQVNKLRVTLKYQAESFLKKYVCNE